MNFKAIPAALNSSLPYLTPGLFLLVLPITHTVSLRLLLLLITLVIASMTFIKGDRAKPPCMTAWLLWLGVAFLSLFSAVDPGYSAGEIKTEIGYGIIAFISFFVLSRSWRQFRIMALFILAGFLVLSCTVVYDGLTGTPWLSDRFYDGVGGFSTYLVTIMPILLLLAYYHFRIKPRLTAAISVISVTFFLLAGLLSMNLMLWVSLALQVLALLLLGVRGHHKLKLTIGLLCVLLALGALLTIGVQKNRILSFTPEGIAGMVANDPRVQHWNNVVPIIAQKPLLGHGFGRAALSKAHPETRTTEALWHSHNVFLDAAVQMGLQGAIILALLFGCLALKFNSHRVEDDRDLHAIGLVGLVLLIGILSKNMTDNFFYRHLSLLFWAETGMLLGLARGLMIERTLGTRLTGQTGSSPAEP